MPGDWRGASRARRLVHLHYFGTAPPALSCDRDGARRVFLLRARRSCSRAAIARSSVRPRLAESRRARDRRLGVHARRRIDLYGLDPGKVVAVPNGVGAHFRPVADAAARVRERFGINTPYMLCVGALQERKNVPLAVEAYSQIGPRNGYELVSPAAIGAAASTCSTPSTAHA